MWLLRRVTRTESTRRSTLGRVHLGATLPQPYQYGTTHAFILFTSQPTTPSYTRKTCILYFAFPYFYAFVYLLFHALGTVLYQ